MLIKDAYYSLSSIDPICAYLRVLLRAAFADDVTVEVQSPRQRQIGGGRHLPRKHVQQRRLACDVCV